MKQFFILIISAIAIFSMNAKAQIKPAQSQYLVEKGFLINPSFEQGFSGWQVTGTCVKSLVNEIPYLNKSLKITCINQNFSVKQETTNQSQLQGQQGVYSAQIKASVDGSSIASLTGTARDNQVNIQSSSSFKRVSNVPYVVSSVSNGIEFYSDSNITGEFIIDEVQLTLSSAGFIQQDYDDVPVGTVLSYGSETLPDGYLLADGSCYKKSEKASLFSVIGTSAGQCTITTSNDGFNVPDLRNQFLRGLTSGRNVFDTQADSTAVNGLDSVAVGNHTHTESYYYADTNAFPQVNGLFTNFGGDGRYGHVGIQASGAAGGHDHTLNGDAETRPANKSVVYIIKAVGRNTRNIFTQTATSPDKAGFIIFSAFDSNSVEGHLKADGSCVLKTSYPDYVENVGTTYGECTISTSNDGVNLPNLISGNRFIRSAGGSISVGTLQADATARNGLSASSPVHGHPYRTLNGTGAPDATGGGMILDGNGPQTNQPANTLTPANTRQRVIGGTIATVNLSAGDSETRPISIALVPFVRMENRDEIKGNFRNGAKLGDCKYSLLSSTDFNTENEGQWVRMEGQSLIGTDIASKFGVNSLPDAVSNGAFFRQTGGNSASIRVFQDDATASNGLTNSPVGNHVHGYNRTTTPGGGVQANGGTYDTPVGDNTSGAGAHNHTISGDVETRPKNISLNFYCLVDK